MGICQKPTTSSCKRTIVSAKVPARNVERMHERAAREADFAYLARRVDLLEARVELFWQRIQQENLVVPHQNA